MTDYFGEVHPSIHPSIHPFISESYNSSNALCETLSRFIRLLAHTDVAVDVADASIDTDSNSVAKTASVILKPCAERHNSTPLNSTSRGVELCRFIQGFTPSTCHPLFYAISK